MFISGTVDPSAEVDALVQKTTLFRPRKGAKTTRDESREICSVRAVDLHGRGKIIKLLRNAAAACAQPPI